MSMAQWRMRLANCAASITSVTTAGRHGAVPVVLVARVQVDRREPASPASAAARAARWAWDNRDRIAVAANVRNAATSSPPVTNTVSHVPRAAVFAADQMARVRKAHVPAVIRAHVREVIRAHVLVVALAVRVQEIHQGIAASGPTPTDSPQAIPTRSAAGMCRTASIPDRSRRLRAALPNRGADRLIAAPAAARLFLPTTLTGMNVDRKVLASIAARIPADQDAALPQVPVPEGPMALARQVRVAGRAGRVRVDAILVAIVGRVQVAVSADHAVMATSEVRF